MLVASSILQFPSLSDLTCKFYVFLPLLRRLLALAVVSVAAGEVSGLDRVAGRKVVHDLLPAGHQDCPSHQDGSQDAPHPRNVLEKGEY